VTVEMHEATANHAYSDSGVARPCTRLSSTLYTMKSTGDDADPAASERQGGAAQNAAVSGVGVSKRWHPYIAAILIEQRGHAKAGRNRRTDWLERL
jgi:hypothetical protein